MRSIAVAAVTIALLTGGCRQAPAPLGNAAPVTEAEANRIADATVAAWTSMDATRIKALYAPSIAGFDYGSPTLTTDRATWDKAQDAYAAARIDSATPVARKVQLLGSDTFVVSGMWTVKSSATPAHDTTIRCTDVYQREAGARWLIVTEHCSAAPKPA